MTFVFYDGDCGLCQRSIRFLSWADKSEILRFAPLNGATYKKLYGDRPSSMTSVLVYSNGKTFEKSAAVFELCQRLGGIYLVFLVFKLVPRFIRDALYEWIAARRKSLSCVLLTKDRRFLD
ncbi:MAG: thiol-disulfide oxidoreductase DCC family protein [Bacteriovorax sp.]